MFLNFSFVSNVEIVVNWSTVLDIDYLNKKQIE